MKKIALPLLTIAMFVACSGGITKQLEGKTYTAGMKVEIKDTTDQMEMMMSQLAEQFKFNMAFEKDGVLKMSMTTTEMAGDSTGNGAANEDVFSWSSKSDSLTIIDQSNTPQSFLVKETGTGFELVNTEVTFVLTPVAQ